MLGVLAGGQPQRVGDISNATHLGQSTVSRLLATLESAAFIERDGGSGHFSLGPDLITLAGVAANQHPLFRASRQVAQNLAFRLGVGVAVAVRRGDAAFYLLDFEGPDAPRNRTLAGQRDPLHATAVGKCLLLGLLPGERGSLLGNLRPLTARTITDHRRLDAELSLAERRGYVTEIEELGLGRAGLAAPIRDAGGAVRGALGISGPLSVLRLDERESEYATAAIESAERIGSAVGYVGA
ncbi:DNA-binding IclR family transcriptional regulator [Leifsonia shinshuensis]|nr:DNA-binding IclR family transcriptional regulator [Leifsonia shinshuensis]